MAAALLVILAPACVNRGPSKTSTADSTAVMTALEEYRQAWLKGDTAAALRHVSNDIRIMISGIPDIDGKDATRKVFVDEMATYQIPTLTLNHQDVIVRGDHAIDIGTYEEIQVPKTGVPIHNRGRFMTIWRREGTEWRIVRYMLN
ncbi:MAG: YybH family protein [Gemmatimonadota bacterium]